MPLVSEGNIFTGGQETFKLLHIEVQALERIQHLMI